MKFTTERSVIEDAIDTYRCEIINESLLDVTWLNLLCEAEGLMLPKTRTMSAALLELGYKQIEGRRIKVSKTKNQHFIWFKGEQGNVTQRVRAFHAGNPMPMPIAAPTAQDNVNNPNHYRQGEVECIDAIAVAVNGLSGMEAVCTANAIKYLWRWKLKNGVEDLKKCQWYVGKLIEVCQNEQIDVRNESE
jgi:hypothetical protein